MKWATNETLGNQGPPAAWLIRRFIDADAEILLLPKATALAEAARVGARTFYVKGGDFYKDARRTTFDALMEEYGLVGKDPALDRMAEIFGDISFRVKQGLELRHAQAPGVRAIMVGVAAAVADPEARLALLCGVFDGLYAWCAAGGSEEG